MWPSTFLCYPPYCKLSDTTFWSIRTVCCRVLCLVLIGPNQFCTSPNCFEPDRKQLKFCILIHVQYISTNPKVLYRSKIVGINFWPSICGARQPTAFWLVSSTRGVASGGPSAPWTLGVQLTLLQPGGKLCPPHYCLPTRIWKPNGISVKV